MKRGRGAPATQDVISSYTAPTPPTAAKKQKKGNRKKEEIYMYEVDVRSPLYPL